MRAIRIGIVAVITGTSPPVAAQEYELIDLGTLGGSYSEASAITENGLVVGWATTAPGVKHAAAWNDGIIDLGRPTPTMTGEAVAANDAGQVAGTGEGSPQSLRAYLWEDGTWTPLGTLPGRNESIAEDIDAAGRIVGRSLTLGGGNSGGFLWEAGAMTDLGTLGGTTSAYGMNDAGLVVGRSQEILPDSSAAPRAFVWEGGVMTSLGVLPGEDFSQAFDINESGDVVGSSWHVTIPGFFSADQATLWRAGGQIVDLGLTPGPQVCVSGFPFYTVNVAHAINDVGQIVGHARCIASGGALAAFLWQDGVMHNLNDLVPAGSGWDLIRASDINDAGEIVGLGIAPGGTLHGFLLRPAGPVGVTAEPASARRTLRASPSPFRGETRVSFDLANAGAVRLTVHDVRGRRVATLADGPRAAGAHSYRWRAAGEDLAGGIYFVRLESAGEVSVRKVTLLR